VRNIKNPSVNPPPRSTLVMQAPANVTQSRFVARVAVSLGKFLPRENRVWTYERSLTRAPSLTQASVYAFRFYGLASVLGRNWTGSSFRWNLPAVFFSHNPERIFVSLDLCRDLCIRCRYTNDRKLLVIYQLFGQCGINLYRSLARYLCTVKVL